MGFTFALLFPKSGELLPRHFTLTLYFYIEGGIISVVLSSPCELLLLGAILPA